MSRPWRGVYIPQSLPGDHSAADEIRRVQSLFAKLPAGSCLSFHTAASWLGFAVLRSTAIHVTVPAGTAHPRLAGVTAHEAVVPPQRVTIHDVPVTGAARTAIDLARTVRRREALAVLDAALRSRQVVADDLLAELCIHCGLRGVRQARELALLADGRAECAQESHLRLLIIDGKLSPPTPQLWVGHSYRLDLGYEERRIGVEYDGASHLDRERLRQDRTRMNFLAANGWRMRYFTDADVYGSPGRIVADLRNLLRS